MTGSRAGSSAAPTHIVEAVASGSLRTAMVRDSSPARGPEQLSERLMLSIRPAMVGRCSLRTLAPGNERRPFRETNQPFAASLHVSNASLGKLHKTDAGLY